MSNNNRSRLRRRVDSQVKKEIIFFVLGIIILIAFLFKFGIGIVTGIGSLFVKINEGSTADQQNTSQNRIIPPVLDPLPQATNSATIDVVGKSIEKNENIQLFINSTLKAETQSDDQGGFEFLGIELLEGQNSIATRIKQADTTSEFSKEYSVMYQKVEPKLEITSPTDNSTFTHDNQEVSIQGKTNPENRVTVNGFWAIVDNDGNFSYTLKLNEGDNAVAIEAQDPAGNKTKKEIKLFYVP